MLTAFGPDIWLSDGASVHVFGFHYPTRMAVIKLADGTLFVWSPIELQTELAAQLDTLGPVTHVVAPNHLHHLALPSWQKAYPDATFHAAPNLRKKRPDVAFEQDLGNVPHVNWQDQIDQVVFKGCQLTTEVVFFHRKSGTVLFTDLLQQFPDDWFSGWRRLVAKLDLMVGSEPSVPRKFRVAITGRNAARASLKRISAWPAKSVVVAHGEPVMQDAPEFLAWAFRWLTR